MSDLDFVLGNEAIQKTVWGLNVEFTPDQPDSFARLEVTGSTSNGSWELVMRFVTLGHELGKLLYSKGFVVDEFRRDDCYVYMWASRDVVGCA